MRNSNINNLIIKTAVSESTNSVRKDATATCVILHIMATSKHCAHDLKHNNNILYYIYLIENDVSK